MTRLSDPVRYQDEITTIAELAERGLVKFSVSADWRGRGKPAYFADLADGGGSWQIGATAYQSRTGQPVRIGE